MSRREDIDNAIWDDPEFARLSPNATLLYLWSWTNPRCGMAGVYKVTPWAMSECKVSEAEIPAALEELAEARFAFYEDNALFVRSRVKHLRARSPKMAVSIARDVEKLPEGHPVRHRFLTEYGSWAWLSDVLPRPSRNGTETVSQKPLGKGDSHTVSLSSPDDPGTGTGSSSSREVELPEDFTRELKPHLEAVHRVLSDLARRHHAKAVSRLSLASVLMARPHKPLVRAAHDYVSWADGQAQRRRDVLAGYRNWVDKLNDLAGFERLPGEKTNGVPVATRGSVRRANDWMEV